MMRIDMFLIKANALYGQGVRILKKVRVLPDISLHFLGGLPLSKAGFQGALLKKEEKDAYTR